MLPNGNLGFHDARMSRVCCQNSVSGTGGNADVPPGDEGESARASTTRQIWQRSVGDGQFQDQRIPWRPV